MGDLTGMVQITRRTFAALIAAGIAAPGILRAQQTDSLEQRARSLGQLHSIQVMRGDETLLAIAPRGPGLRRVANIKSCSKSIVALLLGLAIEDGSIASVDAPLSQVAPGLLPRDATEGAGAITMEDLVTLRAGLERTSGGNYGAWISSSNWIADALSRPMVAEPGGRMLYSTGSTHILGAAIADATGQSLLARARSGLGAPMDMEIPPWERDPQGYYMGGNQMALRPVDMLKVGQLLRDGGRYQGTQVVPESWMAASLRPRARSPWSGDAYGYGWFLTDSGWAYARGYGGQMIAANRDADLVMVITSDPNLPARSEGYFGELRALMEGPVLDLAA